MTACLRDLETADSPLAALLRDASALAPADSDTDFDDADSDPEPAEPSSPDAAEPSSPDAAAAAAADLELPARETSQIDHLNQRVSH